MSDKLHLLIPGAAPLPGTAAQPLPPHLRRLLALLAPAERIACDDDSPATPFELALARAIGLPGEPGHLPWAAHETGTIGTPCAWIIPCHWRVGADHVQVLPREALALDVATSQALLAAMAPYFAEDGIQLTHVDALPGCWLATGEPLRLLRTMSLERAAGRRLTPEMFRASGAGGATIQRLQNEMQMLLYTHPVAEAWQQAGHVPVNSFWVAGAGLLEAPLPLAPHVQVERRLADATALGDAAAHAAAWQAVDADACARLLALLEAGQPVRLTLCGAHAAQALVPAAASAWQRVKSLFGRQAAPDLLGHL